MSISAWKDDKNLLFITFIQYSILSPKRKNNSFVALELFSFFMIYCEKKSLWKLFFRVFATLENEGGIRSGEVIIAMV